MKTTIPIVILSLIALSLGCEKPCKVPAGEYEMALKSISGDCPENVVKQFEEHKDTVKVEDTQQCKRFLTSVDGEIPKTDCKLNMDISAQATEKGLTDGQGIFKLDCQETMSCQQVFEIKFTLLEGK